LLFNAHKVNTTTMGFPEGSRIERLMTILPTNLFDVEVEKMRSRPSSFSCSSASISSDAGNEYKKKRGLALTSAGVSSKEVVSRHVSFGKLEVRYYPIILGDHPDCSEGPPVSFFFRLAEPRLLMFLLDAISN
jgi:hypothetical protein